MSKENHQISEEQVEQIKLLITAFARLSERMQMRMIGYLEGAADVEERLNGKNNDQRGSGAFRSV